jgi:hypothetical protein
VVGPKDEKDPDAFYAKEAYYAAHEGVYLLDGSCYYPCTSRNCGVTVYWSEGKHASYPDLDKLPVFETFKEPGFEAKSGEYTLIDVGTIDNPKAPWILYRRGWGFRKIGSIYKKLRRRLWNRKTWERIKKLHIKKVNIKRFQEYVDLPSTGTLDISTIKASYNIDPHLIQNIQGFGKKEFIDINQSKIRGRDIDFIARAQLPTHKIAAITMHNIRGSALRDYVKGESTEISI